MREDRRAFRDGRLFAASVICLVAAYPIGIYCAVRIASQPSEWWLVPYLAAFMIAAVLGLASGWREGKWIVVLALLCAVLSGLAGPAWVSKSRRVQTVETVVILRKLAEGLEKKLNASASEVVLDSAWTPQARCCEGGGGEHGRCSQRAHATIWQKEPWLSIGFAGPDFDFRYQYPVVRRGERYVIQAKGDNDCDGVTSLYAIEVARNAEGAWAHGFFDVERELE